MKGMLAIGEDALTRFARRFARKPRLLVALAAVCGKLRRVVEEQPVQGTGDCLVGLFDSCLAGALARLHKRAQICVVSEPVANVALLRNVGSVPLRGAHSATVSLYNLWPSGPFCPSPRLDLNFLQGVPHVTVMGFGIESLAPLSGAKSVDIYASSLTPSLEPLRGVRSVHINAFLDPARQGEAGLAPLAEASSVLLNMHCLERPFDMEPLARAETVTLQSCYFVRDLAFLRNAKSVSLYNLPNVTDVSPIRSAKRVSLDWLPKVKDVAPLCSLGVHHLEFISMEESLNEFRGSMHAIEKLSVSYCSLETLGFAAGVPEVELSNVFLPEDLSPLGKARSVKVTKCPELVDAGALGTVGEVWIEDCPRLVTVPQACPGMRKVTLADCPFVEAVAGLRGVPDVTLRGMESVEDVSPLSQAQRLAIKSCPGVKDVSALGRVPDLTLTALSGVDTLEGLGEVQNLCLAYFHVKDAKPLARVKNLALKGTCAGDCPERLRRGVCPNCTKNLDLVSYK